MRGRPLFQADKEHIHHRLIAVGPQPPAGGAGPLRAVHRARAARALILTYASSGQSALLLIVLALRRVRLPALARLHAPRPDAGVGRRPEAQSRAARPRSAARPPAAAAARTDGDVADRHRGDEGTGRRRGDLARRRTRDARDDDAAHADARAARIGERRPAGAVQLPVHGAERQGGGANARARVVGRSPGGRPRLPRSRWRSSASTWAKRSTSRAPRPAPTSPRPSRSRASEPGPGWRTAKSHRTAELPQMVGAFRGCRGSIPLPSRGTRRLRGRDG